MQYKKHAIIVFVTAILGLGTGYLLAGKQSPLESKTLEENETTSLPLDSTSTTTEVAKAPMSHEPVKQEKLSEITLPTLDVVRREAEANPHVTPPSLIKFASAMALPMEAALQSESDAAAFFNYLETCALNAELASSARASCIVNAATLKNKYTPRFDSQFSVILREVPSHILKLARHTNGKDL